MKALLLFAAGLGVRLLFWLATDDRLAPFVAAYQGDAPYWQLFAAGRTGATELALPFRPPAMYWLTALLWDGTGSAWLLRLLMTLLGAAVAPLVYLALRRSFGEPRAWLAGWIC